MRKANTADCPVLIKYFSLIIILVLLLLPLMSCKGKSEEKTKAAAPVTESINIEDCINKLETGDLETSVKAVTDLGNSGKPEALEPLITALEGYEDQEIREAAALALGTLGEPDCTERLIYRLLDEESESVRKAICKALQEYEGFSIDPILYLVRDKDKRIREQGVRHLVGIGDTVLEDVMEFVQESGRITLGDADSLRKNYRDLARALRSGDNLYHTNAVGVCLGLYMEDRDRIATMKNELKYSPYSVVDPYE